MVSLQLAWPMLLLPVLAAASVSATSDGPLGELQAAKANYDSEAGKIRKAISESLAKRLAAAQKAGNAALVNIILAEQKAFDEYGDVPPSTPAGQQRKLAELAAILDKAYSRAQMDLTRAMQTADAAAVEAEQVEFRTKVALQNTRINLLGTWKLEMTNYSADFTFYPDGTMYHSREKFRGTWQVDLPGQRIIVLPPDGGGRGDKIHLPLDPRGTAGQSSSGGTFQLTKKP